MSKRIPSWSVGPRGASVYGPDNMRIAVCDKHNHATLIAAAPDLLAALERLLDERCPFQADTESCECGENGDGRDEHGGICEHIQAHRAIAKAKGA